MRPRTLHASPSETLTSTASPTRQRRVVDAMTRMLHWLMALCFTGAYVSADSEHWRLVHVTLGYTLAGLVLVRLFWGLFGPRQARLSVLWARLKTMAAWLDALRQVRTLSALRASGQAGQKLLMGWAVVLTLLLILPTVLSGYVVWIEWGGEWLEEVHEFFANAMLLAVLVHVGWLVVMSWLRRKNQALPMLTGYVPGRGPDTAQRNYGFLAAVLLACVLAFWLWQGLSAPVATDLARNSRFFVGSLLWWLV